MPSPEWHLAKAYQRLEAARHLREGSFGEDAFNRLYYAAFEAAQAALAAMEVSLPRTHKGVRMQFHHHAVLSRRMTEASGRIFDRLEALRLTADYGELADEDYNLEQVERDTGSFVEAVRQGFFPEFKPDKPVV